MSFTLIGKHEKDSRANRDGYVEAMLEMMAENPKLMHVDCDLMGCINTGKLLKAFPAQTFNAGIAEQNAMGVASGMAATGLTVFAHSFGCFAARRMFDQAFLAAGYSELPVHVIGSDPGVCAAFNGATHMPFEDCALYMNIPNAVVIDSCDIAQTKALTRKLAACGSPSYMRLIRKGFTTVYADGSDFEIGKGVTLRDGKDVTIIASGILVDEALKAEEMLAAKGISARVIDMHTWKPLDEELVLRAAAETGCIVTAENHQVGTGLGSAITNLTSAKNPVPVERSRTAFPRRASSTALQMLTRSSASSMMRQLPTSPAILHGRARCCPATSRPSSPSSGRTFPLQKCRTRPPMKHSAGI